MKSFWEVNKCLFLKKKAVKDVFYDWLIFSGLLSPDLQLHGDDIYFSLEDEHEDNAQHPVC